MAYRPLAITILAWMYFLAPFVKLLFFMAYYQLGIGPILIPILSNYPAWKLINFFILPPLAGFAIIKVRKWGPPVFILCEACMFVGNIHYMQWLNRVNFQEMIVVYTIFCTLTFVAALYLLIPSIRLAYRDPSVRWWEADTRYQIKIICAYKSQNELEFFTGEIQNISRSGVFFSLPKDKKLEDLVDLKISFNDHDIAIDALLVHQYEIDGISGAGLKFKFMDREQKKAILNLIKDIKKTGSPSRPIRRSWKSLLSRRALFGQSSS